jgi:AraC family transcriptional regulator
LAKIAVKFEIDSASDHATGHAARQPIGRGVARGPGWTVEDVICDSGPQSPPFEEQHTAFSIAIVTAGTFQYRAANSHRGSGELMTPGSLLLGNAGEYFECGHEHGIGDRCLSFRYAPHYFEEIAAGAGLRRGDRAFRTPRLPALRALSPIVARACARLVRHSAPSRDPSRRMSWEETAVQMAAAAIRLATSGPAADRRTASPSAIARITRALRIMDEASESTLSIQKLAGAAGLSPYHFIRMFEELTGITPHRYLRRLRLRAAATQLSSGRAKILDVAFDSGFGDVSNFNRAFRAEFGLSPRIFRGRKFELGD